VLVHIKVVDLGGFVQWASDRSMSLEELERRQLDVATELSKQLAVALTRS
jgi:hypothetical protein